MNTEELFFEDDNIKLPLWDISHVEKYDTGWLIITRQSIFDFKERQFLNACWINQERVKDFEEKFNRYAIKMAECKAKKNDK